MRQGQLAPKKPESPRCPHQTPGLHAESKNAALSSAYPRGSPTRLSRHQCSTHGPGGAAAQDGAADCPPPHHHPVFAAPSPGFPSPVWSPGASRTGCLWAMPTTQRGLDLSLPWHLPQLQGLWKESSHSPGGTITSPVPSTGSAGSRCVCHSGHRLRELWGVIPTKAFAASHRLRSLGFGPGQGAQHRDGVCWILAPGVLPLDTQGTHPTGLPGQHYLHTDHSSDG